jgi:hypothetical protein
LQFRDAALKIIWQITKIDKNREELRKEGVLKPLLAIMSLPLPGSQDIIVIALRVLGNLAMDDGIVERERARGKFGEGEGGERGDTLLY